MRAPSPLLGLLVPSTNPTVERALHDHRLPGLLGVDVVVTRLRVLEITTSAAADAQFASPALLDAGRLLADARPGLVTWAGTSGFWRPAAEERELAALAQALGVPTTSSRSAMRAALAETGTGEVAVLTPYVDDVHGLVVASLVADGYRVVAHRNLGERDNLAFSRIDPATLAGHVAALASRGAPVAVVCTNLFAPLPTSPEEGAGPVVVDSVVATLWHGARLLGATSLAYAEARDRLWRSALTPVAACDPGDDRG